jgi:hypothetical protein
LGVRFCCSKVIAKQGDKGGGSAGIAEICAVTSGTAVQDKGALLMKGHLDMFFYIGKTIGVAFFLFFISTAVNYMGSEQAQPIWYGIMCSFTLLYMYVKSRQLVVYQLYENGLRIRNRFWMKDKFYAFDQLEEALTGRSGGTSVKWGTRYHDYLLLRFKGGSKVFLSSHDIEDFYVFRNALLQQIGYFDKEDQGE